MVSLRALIQPRPYPPFLPSGQKTVTSELPRTEWPSFLGKKGERLC